MLLRPKLCPSDARQVLKSNCKAHGLPHGAIAKLNTPNEQPSEQPSWMRMHFFCQGSKKSGKKFNLPEFGS